MIETVVFYVFAALTVISACSVVTVRNPVHAALFLVLTFFTSAVIWLSLEAEFLAISLVLVYVGAVMVLFVFVVMMLDINIARLREGFVRYLPLGLLVAAVMLGLMLSVVTSDVFVLDTGSEPAPTGRRSSASRYPSCCRWWCSRTWSSTRRRSITRRSTPGWSATASCSRWVS